MAGEGAGVRCTFQGHPEASCGGPPLRLLGASGTAQGVQAMPCLAFYRNYAELSFAGTAGCSSGTRRPRAQAARRWKRRRRRQRRLGSRPAMASAPSSSCRQNVSGHCRCTLHAVGAGVPRHALLQDKQAAVTLRYCATVRDGRAGAADIPPEHADRFVFCVIRTGNPPGAFYHVLVTHTMRRGAPAARGAAGAVEGAAGGAAGGEGRDAHRPPRRCSGRGGEVAVV